MQAPLPVVAAAIALATALVLLLRMFGRRRRELLGEFERALDARGDVEIAEYRFGDESEDVTRWAMSGRAGTMLFEIDARDARRGKGSLWYSLTIHEDGVRTRASEFGYGGECQGARRDQARLARIFDRLWPRGGRIPPPDTRPARARHFDPRPS